MTDPVEVCSIWKIYNLIDSKGEQEFKKFDKNQFKIRSISFHL